MGGRPRLAASRCQVLKILRHSVLTLVAAIAAVGSSSSRVPAAVPPWCLKSSRSRFCSSAFLLAAAAASRSSRSTVGRYDYYASGRRGGTFLLAGRGHSFLSRSVPLSSSSSGSGGGGATSSSTGGGQSDRTESSTAIVTMNAAEGDIDPTATEAKLRQRREELEQQLKDVNEQLQVNPRKRGSLSRTAKHLTEQLQLLGQSERGENKCTAASKSELLDSIPPVVMDEGIFKYALIKVPAQQGETAPRYFVRGSKRAAYHYQCTLQVMQQLLDCGVEGEVVGGGRIKHDAAARYVEIYGHSCQFGQPDHSISADLVKKHFGDAYTVEHHDGGY
eukprot:GHVU01135986.1.p1 GENE.GHVU01135986.1~~GHVU01135986.1.p1  ORF type:complete len:333 (+),score=45.17 GHVU01135986.1:1605-2603(+)